MAFSLDRRALFLWPIMTDDGSDGDADETECGKTCRPLIVLLLKSLMGVPILEMGVSTSCRSVGSDDDDEDEDDEDDDGVKTAAASS